jgi:hypothetical protein
MKVKDIDLKENLKRRVKITKLTDDESPYLEGRTGRLTNPFGCFPADGCGIYLDDPGNMTVGMIADGICNLGEEDELEFFFDCEDCGDNTNPEEDYSINGAKSVCKKCYAKYGKCKNCEGDFFLWHLKENKGFCGDCP